MCRSDIEFLGGDKDKLNPSKDNPNTYQLLSCWELMVSQIFVGNQLVNKRTWPLTTNMAMLQRGHQVLLTMARQCAVRHFRSAPILLKAGSTQNEFTGKKKIGWISTKCRVCNP